MSTIQCTVCYQISDVLVRIRSSHNMQNLVLPHAYKRTHTMHPNTTAVLPSYLMLLSGKATVNKAAFLPVYSIQEFNLERDRQWDTERRYYRPLLDELFPAMEKNNMNDSDKPMVNQVYVFSPSAGELEVTEKVSQIPDQVSYVK
ncbi:unnamed protein product [Echinostoma caproni]|uniref:DUF1330 domain-containing protein n=1 Tax=Echinostoma caproni TaxID=27848 RepID=A0A183A2B3_9TREM|nr:unnamed protein product [Echinostoma caproni]